MHYLAHSANIHGQTHLAQEHLVEVSRLAEGFAGRAPWCSEATLAGLLHDLGKYGDLFQARLRGEVSGLDHWSTGAWVALSEYHAVAAALAVQGHHIGLQRGDIQSLRTLAEPHPSHLKSSDPGRGLKQQSDDATPCAGLVAAG